MKQPTVPAATPPSQRVRRLFGAGSLVALLCTPASALAQADIAPPPPNVLLLVDTSGSMDYKTGTNTFPTCRYSGTNVTAQPSERSRWIDLVEVLTGSIPSYDCQRLDRNSTDFKNEYSNPYDFLYPNPFHRAVSGLCVTGPGTLDVSNKALFPATALKYHPFNNNATSCTFNQANDGVLDSFESDVRFGLMTFDTDPSAAKDVTGLWSYYIGSPGKGKPEGCPNDQDQEVGVRNPDAPPWEGRAVGFGDPALGSTDFKTRNSMIQQVLLATRPYGATPIAGMLDDARTYFTVDNSADPLNGSIKFGPLGDPAADCRRKSIVLLSDGQPNMDLRPFCEPGGCPYHKAEDIALDLKSKGIDIYVIGFALSKVLIGGVETACNDIKGDDLSDPAGLCETDKNNTALQACCALNRIAAAGGPTPPPRGADETETDYQTRNWQHAHFADNRDELRHQLSQAIGGNFASTTRTPFVNAQGGGFIAGGADLTFARAFRFAASFKPGKLDNAWVGELNRGRYVCESDGVSGIKPVLQAIDASKGDKFVDNVNTSGPGQRKLFTFLGDAPIKSDASMRPNTVAVDDGVGNYKGTQKFSNKDPSTFTDIPADALNVTDTTCDSSSVNLDAAACRTRYLRWLVGLDNDGVPFKRCPGGVGGDKCNLVAEFYHSVPKAVAGRPSQFLVDSSYQTFVKAQVDAKRPSVLYASSNDGFLHAFKITAASSDVGEAMKVKSKESNELWAFVPPGVLTGIPSFYPGTHQLLLDGTPAIRDVVATKDDTLLAYKYRLQRNLDDARVGIGAWRTILVQSYGSKRSGYFALDVTDPVVEGTGGPKFLWQLNTDAAGNPLFGSGGGTPLITTVFLEGVETAVAVLPGGYGTPGDTSTGCDRKTASYSLFEDAYKPRSNAAVPCYSGRSIQARSLTVVRLDNGQILRSFRQAEAEVPGLVGKGVVTVADLDSPMTGQPVAFPADVGSVADRVFIGDQDGALWRLNFAGTGGDKTKASEWTLELFFDTFPGSGDFGHTRFHGQPIVNAPILSVDERGDLTIAVSTGDQEAIGAASGLTNYVWSLTERAVDDRKELKPLVNWYLPLKGELSGDRVVGDMALFAGDLYFTTVGPAANADACSSGSGKVWGMHYLTPKVAGNKSLGGKPSPSLAALLDPSGRFIDATTLLGSDAHAYLSGVSVGQQPTCDDPHAADDDGYFSYGVSPAHGAITPGRYQLIIPTGDKASSSTKPGITPITQGGVNAVAVDLGTPLVMNYVDSWAAIVE
jgi:type IV pilus assembly protein PilY1